MCGVTVQAMALPVVRGAAGAALRNLATCTAVAKLWSGLTLMGFSLWPQGPLPSAPPFISSQLPHPTKQQCPATHVTWNIVDGGTSACNQVSPP